eukprot:symbB.v1.2.037462.t1/scaffold5542.1/size26012/1
MRQCVFLPDVFSFTTLLGAKSDSDTAWRRAIAVLEEMEDGTLGAKANIATVSSAIDTCERSCQWQLALWLLRSPQLPSPTAVTYSSVMMACSQGSQWTFTSELLNEMSEAVVRIDVVAFGSTLAVFELMKAWRSSLEILQSVFAAEVLPTVVVYASALGPCGWNWALQLLGALTHRQLQADVVARTSVLLSLADAAQWQHALHLLEYGATFLASAAVLRACEDRRKHHQVVKFFPLIHDITMDTLENL